jgi:membrane protein DedA with SNARE-associated domain
MFDWVAFWKYAGVVGTLIGAGFGLPIPEEIPVVTAGAMVGHDAQDAHHTHPVGGLAGGAAYADYMAEHESGRVVWYVMLPLLILGVVLGDTVLYVAGRLFGRRLMHSAFVTKRVLPPDKREKIEKNFRERGVMILLGARFTPGIRTPVFLMSGVLKLPYSRFLLADGLYAIPGVSVLFWLAYLFTDQFVTAIKAVERHKPMILMAVLAFALGILVYRWATTRTLSTGDPTQIPGYAKPVGAAAHAVEVVVEKAVEKTAHVTKDVIDKVAHPHHHAAKPDKEPKATP